MEKKDGPEMQRNSEPGDSKDRRAQKPGSEKPDLPRVRTYDYDDDVKGRV
jgi:hypothetical protein